MILGVSPAGLVVTRIKSQQALIQYSNSKKRRKEREMEESTQMVDLPGEEGSSPILSPPMGYLRVFAQKAIEERNYPVAEGVCVHGKPVLLDL